MGWSLNKKCAVYIALLKGETSTISTLNWDIFIADSKHYWIPYYVNPQSIRLSSYLIFNDSSLKFVTSIDEFTASLAAKLYSDSACLIRINLDLFIQYEYLSQIFLAYIH